MTEKDRRLVPGMAEHVLSGAEPEGFMREVEVVITPKRAKQALHLHWGDRLSDAPHHLAIVTDALETIANLNWKYEVQDYVDGELRTLCVCDTLENAQEKVRCAQVSNPRIVRKLESEGQVVG